MGRTRLKVAMVVNPPLERWKVSRISRPRTAKAVASKRSTALRAASTTSGTHPTGPSRADSSRTPFRGERAERAERCRSAIDRSAGRRHPHRARGPGDTGELPVAAGDLSRGPARQAGQGKVQGDGRLLRLDPDVGDEAGHDQAPPVGDPAQGAVPHDVE